jgi:hypothetical protein
VLRGPKPGENLWNILLIPGHVHFLLVLVYIYNSKTPTFPIGYDKKGSIEPLFYTDEPYKRR